MNRFIFLNCWFTNFSFNFNNYLCNVFSLFWHNSIFFKIHIGELMKENLILLFSKKSIIVNFKVLQSMTSQEWLVNPFKNGLFHPFLILGWKPRGCFEYTHPTHEWSSGQSHPGLRCQGIIFITKNFLWKLFMVSWTVM